MDLLVNKMLKHMAAEENNWTELEILKMQLGFQVLFHNIFMTGLILILAKILGIFTESVVLLTGYGLLKMTAGGIHFKKSYACLLSTSVFIISGVFLSKNMELSFAVVLIIYFVCMLILWLVGPQGTENNPISEENYDKLRYRTMLITGIYLLITIFLIIVEKRIPYLLMIATAFETISVLPEKIKSRCRG